MKRLIFLAVEYYFIICKKILINIRLCKTLPFAGRTRQEILNKNEKCELKFDNSKLKSVSEESILNYNKYNS